MEVESSGLTRKTIRCSDADPFDGRWNCPIDISGPDETQISIRVRGKDRAGNLGDWTNPVTVIIDGTPPTLSLSAESQGKIAGPLNPRDLTLSGSISDNRAVAALEYCVDQQIRCTQISLGTGDSTSANWQIAPLLESSNDISRTLYLIAVDQAGNRTTPPATYTIQIDTTPPELSVRQLFTQIELAAYRDGDGPPVLSGTVSESQGVSSVQVHLVDSKGGG